MDMAGECRVYSRFTRTRPDGTVLKLRIQEMPEENLPQLLDLNENVFIVEEPVHRATGLYLSEEAKTEYTAILSALMGEHKPHIIICCEDDDPVVVKNLAGASIMQITTEMMDLSKIPVQTKEVKKLFEMATKTFYTYDAVNEHGVDKFYDDVFIVVHPDYRRLGIAQEFVHLRRVICGEHNVPLTIAWMSATGTQRAAEADNWELIYEIDYDDLSKQYDLVFEGAPKTTKLMLGRPESSK